MPAAKKIDAAEVVEEVVEAKPVKAKPAAKTAPKTTKAAEAEKPLSATDEVAIESLVPYRVSYEDKNTYDKYVWEGVGEVQHMTLDAATRMRRNFPGYFESMEVMPTDERVIDKLNLKKFYVNTEHMMKPESYTRNNIGKVIAEIKALRPAPKVTVLQKIKGMIETGEITDVMVIRTIEKQLGVDLIAFL